MTRSLGSQIALLRKRANLSQSQLAQQVGLRGNGHLSRIEAGRVLPSEALLDQVARALAVDPMGLRYMAREEGSTRPSVPALTRWDEEVEALRAHVHSLVENLARHMEDASRRIAAAVETSRLNIAWSLDQKLAVEAQAREVWVFSPKLELETGSLALRKVVSENVRRGVSYRYLIPERPVTVGRARRLLRELPLSKSLEIRAARPSLFALATEIVFYDPNDPARRLALAVSPTRHADLDVVIAADHAERMRKAYLRYWNRSQNVTCQTQAPRAST